MRGQGKEKEREASESQTEFKPSRSSAAARTHSLLKDQSSSSLQGHRRNSTQPFHFFAPSFLRTFQYFSTLLSNIHTLFHQSLQFLSLARPSGYFFFTNSIIINTFILHPSSLARSLDHLSLSLFLSFSSSTVPPLLTLLTLYQYFLKTSTQRYAGKMLVFAASKNCSPAATVS